MNAARASAAALPALGKAFLAFALVSGMGWLLDFLAFATLAKLAGASPFSANLVSSYVGITFVWFASLRVLFRRAGRPALLAGYWGYHALSILAYSQLVHVAVTLLGPYPASTALLGGAGIAAKIAVTPLNLLSNFVFMKLLVRSMQPVPRHGG